MISELPYHLDVCGIDISGSSFASKLRISVFAMALEHRTVNRRNPRMRGVNMGVYSKVDDACGCEAY